MSQTYPQVVDLRANASSLSFGFYGCLAIAVMTGLAGLAMIAQGGIVFLLLSAGCAALAFWLRREAQSAKSARVRIEGDALYLTLPVRRSQAPQPAFDGAVSLASIVRIESREEAFRALGVTEIQRAYALSFSNGAQLMLGADRPKYDLFYGRAAQAIATARGLQIEDLGLYEAHAGPSLMAGATTPDWNAAPLDARSAAKRRNGAAIAAQILGGLALLLVVLRACSAFSHG